MALGTIPFTISETANITRLAGGTLSSMRFPIAIPLRFDENKLNASQFRVVDTTTSQAVPAAFRIADQAYTHSRLVGGARWGDYGNTAHRIKLVHIDMVPTLGANETRTFQLQTTGGTGNTPGGITVGTSNPAYYEVNTGPQGVTCRVPRTGPMDVIRFLQENATGRVVSNGGGGLHMKGLAGVPTVTTFVASNPANNQSGDYFSINDTSGDGADNGGDVLESARPTKYFTSILWQNSQSVCIKIDTIRCLDSNGVAFQGMNKFYTNSGTNTARPVTWDVYLFFYRNSAMVRIVPWCHSTGSGEGFVISQPGSVALTTCGFDFKTSWTGSTQATVRDETGTNRLRRVTSATAKTVRQRRAPTTATYGHSLNSTGDFPVSTAATMLDACYDVSDGQKGLLVMLRDWRERPPMGWSHTPATGTLRAEFLNPEETDWVGASAASNPPVSARGNCYALLASMFIHWELMIVAHTGAFTDQQINDHVRALAGQHEQKNAGVWAPTPSLTTHGAQNPTLFGYANSEHWHDTHIWRAMPTMSVSRPDLLGLPNTFIGLPSKTNPANSALNDVHQRWDDWEDARHDNTKSTPDTSQRSRQATTTFRQWWDWRNFGCVPCSGGAFCANEYEANSSPIYHFLRRGDRGDLQLFYEQNMHQLGVDQWHTFPSLYTVPNAFSGPAPGRMSDINNGAQHYAVGITGMEYQNQIEGFAFGYFLTGEPWFLDGCIWFLANFDCFFYGGQGGQSPNYQHYRDDTGTVTNGTLSVANPSFWQIGAPDYLPGSFSERISVRPANLDADNYGRPLSTVGSGCTVTSTGDWIIIQGTVPGRLAEWSDVAGGNRGATQYAQWPGSVLNVGGTEYKIRMLAPPGFFGLATTSNSTGTQTVFPWGPMSMPLFTAGDLLVQVGGVTQTLNTHYTVQGVGTTSGTVTFVTPPPLNAQGGGIPVLREAYRSRAVLVTPAPGSTHVNAAASLSYWAGFFSRWILTCTGKSGNVLQGTWLQNDVPPSGTAVTVHPYVQGFPQSRAHGYMLNGVVGLARIVGKTITTKWVNPGGTRAWNLYKRIADCVRFFIWWEQHFSHPSIRVGQGVEPGGMGCFPYVLASLNSHIAHGSGNSTHSTYLAYPAPALIAAHEYGVQCRDQGLSVTEFDATYKTDLGNLLYRVGCGAQMGADGISPILTIDLNPVTTAKRMPIARGGRLNSPTSYALKGTMYEWSWSSDPATATRQRGDFFYSTDTPSGFQTFGGLFWGNTNGDAMKISLFIMDLLAYVARTKLHEEGQLAKRDLWAQTAMELCASIICLTNQNYLFGDSRNPQAAYPATNSGYAANGLDFGRASNVPQYRLRFGFEPMQLAKLGFAPGVPDTQAPTETQALALVSKTDTQIVVDGPAATDNVGVVGYRFFKDGVQDGQDAVTTSHTYTGLSASTTYALTRRAFDAAGLVSNPSNTLNIQTNAAVDTTAPDVPVINTPRTVTSTTIVYTWPAVTDGGANPSGLRRYRFSFDGAADVLIDQPTAIFTAANLVPETAHTGRVRAEDNDGNISAYSATVNDTTLAATTDTEAPTKPGPPEIVSRTRTSLTVTFEVSTDNVAVEDYVVTASDGHQVSDGTAVPGATTTVTAPPAVLSGLTAFSDYTVTVQARDTATPANVSEANSATLRTLPASRVINGTSELLRATVLSTQDAYPLTVAVKFYPTVLAPGFIWSLANHLSNDHWLAIKLLSNGTVQAIRSNATGFAPGATSLGTVTLNAWNRVVAVFASATLCTIRLNTDATAGEDVTAKTFPTGLTRDALGRLDRLTPVQDFTGRVAQRGIWSGVALDPVEQGALLAGASYWTVRRTAFVSFVPCALGESPELDLIGASDMTLVGTTTADGPEDVLDLTDPVPPGPPEPPTNVAVQTVGATSVTITFTQGANTSSTRVRRADTSVVFELPAEDTTFVDNGLAPFTTFHYTFAGVQGAVESAQTATVTVTTRPVHRTAATGRTLRSGITPKS